MSGVVRAYSDRPSIVVCMMPSSVGAESDFWSRCHNGGAKEVIAVQISTGAHRKLVPAHILPQYNADYIKGTAAQRPVQRPFSKGDVRTWTAWDIGRTNSFIQEATEIIHNVDRSALLSKEKPGFLLDWIVQICF
ncbi:hypothetical protein J6590_030486 [Homalodisca vitripennis]|nr:hypothetical protein J6590_030486 [Homalodisca vitripennis]